MREFFTYFGTGIACGFLYFSALWGSLHLLPKFERKKTYLLVSTLVRMVLLLGVFYFIITSSKYGIFYAVTGFVIARIAFIKIKGITEFENKNTVSKNRIVP